MNATEVGELLGTLGAVAGALPDPAARLVSALLLLGKRACEINPDNPVQVVEDASLAVIEAAVKAKYGS